MTCRNIIEVYDITPSRRGVIKRSVKKTPAPLEREWGQMDQKEEKVEEEEER